jgi:hypothetical protein
MNKHASKLQLILIGVAVFAICALCIIPAVVYGYMNGIQHQAIDHETKLTAQGKAFQKSFDDHVTGVKEQAGIAFLAGDEYNQVIENALRGVYGEEGFQQGSPLFLAFAPAFPDNPEQLVAIWGDIVQAIRDNRAKIANEHKKLQDEVRAYRKWMEEDLFRSMVIDWRGFPSDELEYEAGGMVYHGEDALEKMMQPVISTEASTALDTGVFEGVNIQGTPEPAATKPEDE